MRLASSDCAFALHKMKELGAAFGQETKCTNKHKKVTAKKGHGEIVPLLMAMFCSLIFKRFLFNQECKIVVRTVGHRLIGNVVRA